MEINKSMSNDEARSRSGDVRKECSALREDPGGADPGLAVLLADSPRETKSGKEEELEDAKRDVRTHRRGEPTPWEHGGEHGGESLTGTGTGG